MNKTELIDAVAKDTGLSKVKASEAVGSVLEQIMAAVAGGDGVALPGFGSFGVTQRAARTGRNPQTGQSIQIAASTSPTFKAGAVFKARVGGK